MKQNTSLAISRVFCCCFLCCFFFVFVFLFCFVFFSVVPPCSLVCRIEALWHQSRCLKRVYILNGSDCQFIRLGIAIDASQSSQCTIQTIRLLHVKENDDWTFSNTCNSNVVSQPAQGHLCLWREDSLKEKYNTKYYKIYFYLIFRACK